MGRYSFSMTSLEFDESGTCRSKIFLVVKNFDRHIVSLDGGGCVVFEDPLLFVDI